MKLLILLKNTDGLLLEVQLLQLALLEDGYWVEDIVPCLLHLAWVLSFFSLNIGVDNVLQFDDDDTGP